MKGIFPIFKIFSMGEIYKDSRHEHAENNNCVLFITE